MTRPYPAPLKKQKKQQKKQQSILLPEYEIHYMQTQELPDKAKYVTPISLICTTHH